MVKGFACAWRRRQTAQSRDKGCVTSFENDRFIRRDASE
jgi:hypothetical protein